MQNMDNEMRRVRLGDRSYEIVVRRGCLQRAGEYLDLDRRVLIVTDSGVPAAYAETVAGQCREPVLCTIEQGEENKSIRSWQRLLETMLDHSFTRKDCVVAVGGGICGDLAGFSAASYMRGIDFYNIPTTVLAQVDSSIGGKTAVNLKGIKNAVGAFYQPRKVLIDVEVLKSLPDRHIQAGLAEALKMAVTLDEELFYIFEQGEVQGRIEEIVDRSLQIKAAVVEKDETEQGLRRVLNFGHTIGHAIESQCRDGRLYHGECVAMGMIPMCSLKIRERLLPILESMHLPTDCRLDIDRVCAAMLHDKKAEESGIRIVETDRIGTFRIRNAKASELREKAMMIVHS